MTVYYEISYFGFNIHQKSIKYLNIDYPSIIKYKIILQVLQNPEIFSIDPDVWWISGLKLK